NYLGAEDIRAHRAFAESHIDLEAISAKDNEKYFGQRHPLSADRTSVKIKFKIGKGNSEMTFEQIRLDPNTKVTNAYGEEIIQYTTGQFFGFPASEDQNNFIYPFFSKRKIGRYSSLGNSVNTYSVIDSFQNLPAKVQKTASQLMTRSKYEKWCKDVLGFEVTAVAGENNDYRLGIYSGYNSYIPMEAMGEGVANIIGLITILLTEDNRLFLIEELENDIHPVALKKLLNLIIEKSERNQFIISTHSNIVLKYLGSLEATKIFYTEYDPNGTADINIPTSSIIEVPNTFQDRLNILELLGYDLFDYDLYKGYIIFEESSAEVIVREFIIPFFFLESKSKVRTIAAQGASDLEPKFNDLHRLFLYLHTSEIYKNRAWAIADGDSAGKDAINKLKERFSSWDSAFFLNFEKENFEEYYPTHFKNEINEVLKMGKSPEKREKKATLLKSVITWMNENKGEAREALQESAKEIIEKMGQILKRL
ncbi:MAG TPA: AAA family ATPase, partial [Puia sp.]|nr:AAA family ATPase [Puia sp.]